MGEIAISLKNVSKCYKRYAQPVDRIKDQLLPGKSRADDFWALRNVSLEIYKGQTLGVIGRNGSGKSTLLQIIAGTLTPTTGEVEVIGRISALLELGSGFNSQFTGRQNVFFNGRLLGLAKDEIEAKFDDIVTFADIGDFLEQPAKTYSSGMMARLAFAVQAFVEPDILIIDETLSVGDIFFQQKCARKMNQLRENGTTILFVSHDMGSVRNLCSQAIYLKKGILVGKGNSEAVIHEYFKEGFINQVVPSNKQKSISSAIKLDKEIVNNLTIKSIVPEDSIENEFVRIIAVNVLDKDDEPSMKFKIGEKSIFQILLEPKQELLDVHFTVYLKNRFDQLMFCGGSYTNKHSPFNCNAGETVIMRIELVLSIEAGEYTFALSIGRSFPGKINVGEFILKIGNFGPLQVTWDYENEVAPFFGLLGLEHTSLLSCYQSN